MFKFLKGLKARIDAKAVADSQVLFSTDTNQLFFDIGSTRYQVKDPKSLAYASHVISLKDVNGTVISSVDISSPTVFTVNTADGHMYYNIPDYTQGVNGDLSVNGNLSVSGTATIDGGITTTGDIDVNATT